MEAASRATLAALFCCLTLLPGALAEEEGGGPVFYPGKPGKPGPVLFSHRAHGPDGAGYACEKCHTSSSPEARGVGMDEMRRGQACGACHDGETTAPHTLKTAAPIRDCAACHMPGADIVIPMNRMDPVPFSHLRHLAPGPDPSASGGFNCRDCHPAPFERTLKGPPAMEVPHESGGCAECHNGRQRADGRPVAFPATRRCLTCHVPPEPPARNIQE
jgi:c(7)-type cytochrome triheme protein